MPLDDLFRKRIVLVTGKGGVGRSLVTAALAKAAAKRDVRPLVAEIGDDPSDYSPLARYFGRDRLPIKPEELAPGVRGVVLLARTGQEGFLRTALHSSTLARAALSSDALRRLLSAGPSFREMGVFFQLLTYLKEQSSKGEPTYPLILVDMPATGHTLSLTGLPDLLLRLMPKGPIATALREGQSYLNDPERAAALVVTLPETLPVSEALELLEGLARTSMPVGGVIVNRLPADPFSEEERAALRPMFEKRDVLGAEGFRRPDLAKRETARLRGGMRHPLYSLPELPHASLVDALAKEIEAARSTGPSMRP
jgi:anion-transporting  ArsA/GET3 family ATPase